MTLCAVWWLKMSTDRSFVVRVKQHERFHCVPFPFPDLFFETAKFEAALSLQW
jgi:hypothetical protein